MNWMQFLLLTGGIYGVYYLVIVLLDTMVFSKNDARAAFNNELTFTEPHSPITTKIPAATEPVSEIIETGGVSIKSLFSLAREEAIIYTRAVSF